MVTMNKKADGRSVIGHELWSTVWKCDTLHGQVSYCWTLVLGGAEFPSMDIIYRDTGPHSCTLDDNYIKLKLPNVTSLNNFCVNILCFSLLHPQCLASCVCVNIAWVTPMYEIIPCIPCLWKSCMYVKCFMANCRWPKALFPCSVYKANVVLGFFLEDNWNSADSGCNTNIVSLSCWITSIFDKHGRNNHRKWKINHHHTTGTVC